MLVPRQLSLKPSVPVKNRIKPLVFRGGKLSGLRAWLINCMFSFDGYQLFSTPPPPRETPKPPKGAQVLW